MVECSKTAGERKRASPLQDLEFGTHGALKFYLLRTFRYLLDIKQIHEEKWTIDQTSLKGGF